MISGKTFVFILKPTNLICMKHLTFILFFVSGLFLASCSKENDPEPVFKASDRVARKSTPAPPPTSSLAKPTNLRVTNITSTGATLNWDAVPNAKSYRIGYRELGGYSVVYPWKAEFTSNTSVTTQPVLEREGWRFEWRVDAVYDDSNAYNIIASDKVEGSRYTLLLQ